MAIGTYAELKAAVASWLHRSDLTTQIADFITLAEEAISRDLADCPAMWVTQSGIALGTGASSISLPVSALGLRSLRITSPYARDVPIVPYDQLVRSTALDATLSGAPQCAAMAANAGGAGELSVRIYPAADTDYTLEATYPSGVVALSDLNTTNFILTRAPSIYLFGTLKEAEPWLSNDERVGLWESKYRAAIEAFTAQRWAGQMYLGTELAGLGVGGGSGFNINSGI